MRRLVALLFLHIVLGRTANAQDVGLAPVASYEIGGDRSMFGFGTAISCFDTKHNSTYRIFGGRAMKQAEFPLEGYKANYRHSTIRVAYLKAVGRPSTLSVQLGTELGWSAISTHFGGLMTNWTSSSNTNYLVLGFIPQLRYCPSQYWCAFLDLAPSYLVLLNETITEGPIPFDSGDPIMLNIRLGIDINMAGTTSKP